MVFACTGHLFLLAVFLSSFLLGSSEFQTKNDELKEQRLLLTKKLGYSLLHEYRTTLFKHDLNLSSFANDGHASPCSEAIGNMSEYEKMKYVDAAGKPTSGLFRGNGFWIGSFAECNHISDAHYCLSTLSISLLGKAGSITWSACFPKSCGPKDINFLMKYFILPLVEKEIGVEIGYKGPICPTKAPYTTGVKVTLAICGVLLLLCLIGTLIDWAKEAFGDTSAQTKITGPSDSITNLRNGMPSVEISSTNISAQLHVIDQDELNADDIILLPKGHSKLRDELSKIIGGFCEFFLCFSLVRNTNKIFNTNVPPIAITSINGIRVISLSWVILGHAFMFFAMNPLAENRAGLIEDGQRFTAMPVINGYFSVDSFFFLSGLLVAYTCFRKLRNSNGKFNWFLFYFHRFWRLTPSYMFVILFSVQLKRFLSDGPLWYTQYKDPFCSKYWWANLLYINNFYPTNLDGECVGWTWYLANDMQFFVITPFLLIPLFKLGWRGLVMPLGLLLESSVLIAFIIGHYDLDPLGDLKFANLAEGAKKPAGPPNDFTQLVYIKPYCRIQPYLVGFLLGYFMYKNYKSMKRPGWVVTLVGWTVAIVVGMLLVYGPHQSIVAGGAEWSKTENILYGTFERLLWGLVLVWVTYACHYGAGGLVQKFLSAKFWIPLSRLTYSVYLIHLIVLPVLFVGSEGLMHYDIFTVSYYFIATVVLSYGAGFILAVTIEFPCDNLENLALKALKGISWPVTIQRRK